jgi:hypothetical protein
MAAFTIILPIPIFAVRRHVDGAALVSRPLLRHRRPGIDGIRSGLYERLDIADDFLKGVLT